MRKIIKGIRHPIKAYKYVKEKLDLKRGIAPPPTGIAIQPTIACNLKCRMCTQHLFVDLKSDIYKTMLKISHLKGFLNQLGYIKPHVELIGGEPMVHPEIDEIISEIKSRSHFISITTNGFRLSQKAQFLVDSGVDSISVSIDGREEINDQNRGKGSFKTAAEGIRELIKVRNKNRSTTPKITIISTVSDITYSHLSDVADVALELGVDKVHLSHLQFYPREVIDNQIYCMKRFLSECFEPDKLKMQIESFEKFKTIQFEPIDAEILLQQIELLRRRLDNKIPLTMLPAFSENEIRRFYSDPNYKRPETDICMAPYQSVTLASTGDISFCLGYYVGNIDKISLWDIWNDKRTRHFRKMLYNHGRFPMCHRCCN